MTMSTEENRYAMDGAALAALMDLRDANISTGEESTRASYREADRSQIHLVVYAVASNRLDAANTAMTRTLEWLGIDPDAELTEETAATDRERALWSLVRRAEKDLTDWQALAAKRILDAERSFDASLSLLVDADDRADMLHEWLVSRGWEFFGSDFVAEGEEGPWNGRKTEPGSDGLELLGEVSGDDRLGVLAAAASWEIDAALGR